MQTDVVLGTARGLHLLSVSSLRSPGLRGGVPRPVRCTRASRLRCRGRRLRCHAGAASEDSEADDGGVTLRDSLNGEELRELVVAKWGRPYDTRLCKRRDRFNRLRMYLQIMWKFQGQKSFPVTAEQYAEQLDAVAELLTEWGVVEEAIKGIKDATTQPSVDTVGANAVMIPLSVDVE